MITSQQLKDAAHKAYDENRLIAQNGGIGLSFYENKHGHVCGIGAALPSELRKSIRSLSISALKKNHDISFEDYIFACRVQFHHDGWAAAVIGRRTSEHKDHFLSLISHPEAYK